LLLRRRCTPGSESIRITLSYNSARRDTRISFVDEDPAVG
jgi:hypothetical protein